MSARRLIPGFALSALLAACTAGPPPRPPASQLVVPAQWRAPVGPAASVEAGWWRAFRDPALDALVERALAANADLRTAQLRIAEYTARLTVAQAGQSPALNANLGPSRARARTATGAIRETTLYQGTVQVSYEVDLWGRLDRLEAAAIAELQLQRDAVGAAALSVAANTASGYLNLRALDAQLEVARATLRSREDSLRHAQRLYDEGYSSRLEWLQFESEYRAAAGAVPQLQRAIEQQENALSILVAGTPGPVPRGPAVGELGLPALTAPLPSALLRRRPDVAQAEQRLIAADATLAATRDQLLPSLQLGTSANLQGFTLSQLINAPDLLWTIGGSVLAPVLQGGRLRAQTEIAAAQRDQAVVAYEQTARNAFVEVDNALAAIAYLDAQLVEARARRDSAAQALRIAANRYRNGYASYLDELDAQRSSYAAQQGVLQLDGSLRGAYVDLYRALGGGWTTAAAADGTR